MPCPLTIFGFYTGNIFELMSKDKKIGSIGGGGRYDKLISKLSNQKVDLPAVGFSFGIERIIEIIKDSGVIPIVKTVVDVYLLPVNQNMIPKAIDIANKLRDKGYNCAMDLMGRSISKQLEYASTKGIKKVIIIGPKDLKNKKVTIKNMETGKEEKVSIKDIFNSL